MKTIEERAKKYALQFEKRYQVAMFKAYIKGATEQKQIDDQHILFLADAHEHEKKMLVEKACEFIYEELANCEISCNVDVEIIIKRLKKTLQQ